VYLRWMFGSSRASIELLQKAVVALTEGLERSARDVRPTESADDLRGRVEDLERTRSLWEAEMEAQLLKAKGKYQAASNAESRARTQVAHYEKNAVEGDPDLREESEEERIERLYWRDVEAGQENGLPEMPLAVEARPSSKQAALRAKYS